VTTPETTSPGQRLISGTGQFWQSCTNALFNRAMVAGKQGFYYFGVFAHSGFPDVYCEPFRRIHYTNSVSQPDGQNLHTFISIARLVVIQVSKAGFTLRRLDRRLDKCPASLVKVAKSI